MSTVFYTMTVVFVLLLAAVAAKESFSLGSGAMVVWIFFFGIGTVLILARFLYFDSSVLAPELSSSS